MRRIMFIYLAALFVAFLAIPASAEEGFSMTILDAKDVDCSSECHAVNPHTIHASKPVSCVDCHGESLSIAIPQCANCHAGQIHDVHKDKVDTQDCSYCHQTLEIVHNSALGSSVCIHCHKDMITDHGGEVDSCVKCHSTVPNIVKPFKTVDMDIVCQTCHVSENIASIHGNESNKKACYDCHRPGEGDVTASQIPHNIHIPAITCIACHMEDESITVPECVKCHDIDELHSFGSVGTKSKDDMKCSACHPNSYLGSENPAPVEQEAVVPKEDINEEIAPIEQEDDNSILPGFGIISAIGAIAALYFVNRRK